MVIRDDHRKIIKRLIIRGNLHLITPTCLGSGDQDSLTDMALLRDSITERALLPGTSLGGALRNYLQERLSGYGQEQKVKLLTQLFGGKRGDEDGEQSALVIHDSISHEPPKIEFRDGVKIDSRTGTAVDGAKYDLELVAAGTIFPLMIELLVEDDANLAELKQGLAISLQGLENSEISLGIKKTRGFGQCKVTTWQVDEFNLTNLDHLKDWLNYNNEVSIIPDVNQPPDIATQLDVSNLTDERSQFTLSATFELQGGGLIRSGQDAMGIVPDVVHLTAKQDNGEVKPIISGTSWTGVLRHRAERILNTLEKGQNGTELLECIFGQVPEKRIDTAQEKQARASRLVVHESPIHDSASMVQNRIAIDRFTGGAFDGALFDEQPVFGGEVTLNLELRNPYDRDKDLQKQEIGLLLLLLKDLWTGDLPIGGTSSIGRGRLRGKDATITQKGSELKQWKIIQESGQLQVSNLQDPSQEQETTRQELEDFVSALNAA
ncbi:ramp superfamily protein probably involved in dna repair [Leptolyngbya sp. Heron Island J]|uniref:RAMP superfamily CRISPR-associated protein n=1 Tax=Leptolyngbya sp. Heron Island J TaxID=1385935 RepID=UPI0003B957ED|nr:RAMP superfamily CRISPR-associated protein [Leptolyngbya sp. Heron Island J]ESA32291.1 ramp superfamily protein probably involved in dna repair [Leptolyngbya sp. Heron Island J]